MRSGLALFALMLVAFGCSCHERDDREVELSSYVGRTAETRQQLVIYKWSVFGRMAVPVGEWSPVRNERVVAKVGSGTVFEVIGISAHQCESGKRFYLTCRIRAADAVTTFEYPADEKLIGPGYILWQ
jgi:hypothetical protein